MDLDEIKALIAMMGESDLAEMTLSRNGWTLRLVRGPVLPASSQNRPPAALHPPASAPVRAQAASAEVAAPMAGLVHLRPAPEAPPFVEAGQAVSAGDAICLIEAMKTFNTVRAERDGTIAAILVASVDEVEAGQPLLRFA